MIGRVLNILIITRPLNVVITAVSVWVGCWYAEAEIGAFTLFNACFSAGLICAAGNIFNDYLDVEADRVIKPGRPFAAGKVTSTDMIVSGILLFVFGLYLSFQIGYLCFIIAAGTVIGLMFYNVSAKNIPFFGNVLVGVLSSLAFFYGSAAAGRIWAAAVPGIFSLLYHTGREILKDVEDIEGDKRTERRTIPIEYGMKKAVNTGLLFLFAVLVLTPLPYIYLDYSIYYLVVVIAGVDLMIWWMVILHYNSKNLRKIGFTNKALKIGMILGIAALLLK
ncbi:MAG: UbiA family prenyltransferase [bacterium]|nr:UbiA family prenyltransferase [bacterium]